MKEACSFGQKTWYEEALDAGKRERIILKYVTR